MSTHTFSSLLSTLVNFLHQTTTQQNSDSYNGNNENGRYHYPDNNNGNNNNNRNNHNRHNNQDSPKASAVLFLSLVVSIFLLVILTHLFHLYVLRKEPYYYSVQSDIDPTLWHVERVVPLRERIRRWKGQPRSDSDVFRDEDLERVRKALTVRGWRGRVNSDGTPNKHHRVGDDRAAAAGFAAGGVAGMGFGYGYANVPGGRDVDVEYGPRQYVETEDTPFWKERRWGHNYGTYAGGFGGGMSPDGRRKVFGFGSPSAMGSGGARGHQIPGLSSSKWPAGVATPEFGSVGKNPGLLTPGGAGANGGYGLSAAFSYQASPRNTHFVTPPIRASSKILEGLKHTGLRYTTERSARFPDEELQEHYKGLCESEDAALKELEDARNAAAVQHTYGTATEQEPDHAQRVIEKLTDLEKKLLNALKRRSLFAERFAIREEIIEDLSLPERGESSRGPSMSEPPPPYTDIDEHGLQFDDDNEQPAVGGTGESRR